MLPHAARTNFNGVATVRYIGREYICILVKLYFPGNVSSNFIYTYTSDSQKYVVQHMTTVQLVVLHVLRDTVAALYTSIVIYTTG